eukprot:3126288-Pleurochrysis_carterae.AAC.1
MAGTRHGRCSMHGSEGVYVRWHVKLHVRVNVSVQSHGWCWNLTRGGADVGRPKFAYLRLSGSQSKAVLECVKPAWGRAETHCQLNSKQLALHQLSRCPRVADLRPALCSSTKEMPDAVKWRIDGLHRVCVRARLAGEPFLLSK